MRFKLTSIWPQAGLLLSEHAYFHIPFPLSPIIDKPSPLVSSLRHVSWADSFWFDLLQQFPFLVGDVSFPLPSTDAPGFSSFLAQFPSQEVSEVFHSCYKGIGILREGPPVHALCELSRGLEPSAGGRLLQIRGQVWFVLKSRNPA